jgi:hypothetical protein
MHACSVAKPCNTAPQDLRTCCLQVILDSAILGPFYVAGFFAYGVYVMEGGGREQFRKKMETDFLPTLAAEMAIWPLFQTFNFTKVGEGGGMGGCVVLYRAARGPDDSAWVLMWWECGVCSYLL